MGIPVLESSSRGPACDKAAKLSIRRCAFGYPLEAREVTRSSKKTSTEEPEIDWPPWPTWPPRAREDLSHKTPPPKDPDPSDTTPEDIDELADISPNSREGVVRMIDLLDGVYGSDYLFLDESYPVVDECDQNMSSGECARDKR